LVSVIYVVSARGVNGVSSSFIANWRKLMKPNLAHTTLGLRHKLNPVGKITKKAV